MKEKLKTFVILIIHFVGILSMGITLGETLERGYMNLDTYITFGIMTIWIGCYIYLFIKIKVEVKY